ncbi:hypothetical protein H0X48_00650 [Candidatus Dependentiae bacterium]|nr:hypothetical protein [Candidatus Dependentiae bacterium]
MNNYFSFLFALTLMSSSLAETPRNPFKYGHSCLARPFCECIALGQVGADPFGLVSVNGILYTVKKGDRVAGYEVTHFTHKGIIFNNNKNQEVRLFLKQKALQLT